MENVAKKINLQLLVIEGKKTTAADKNREPTESRGRAQRAHHNMLG
jgi:hypothetical protein